jgi:hypothetical protein
MHARLVLGLICSLSAGALIAYGAGDDAENVKLVTSGRIEKIDTKHKTVQFKFLLDPQHPVRVVRQQPYPGRRGGMGGRRGRIGGYPGGQGPVLVQDNSKEVKLFISEATKLKERSTDLQFSDLKAGDRVTITATHRGKGDDLNAWVIARD